MDGPALLNAILSNPGDDTPRLVYADWLDENGRADRAAFIRAQVELARLAGDDPRRPGLVAAEAELFETLRQDELSRDLPAELGRYGGRTVGYFRRGFLSVVWLEAGTDGEPAGTDRRFSRSQNVTDFVRIAPLLFRHAPIEELGLSWALEVDWNSARRYGYRLNSGMLADLADTPELARLSVLRLQCPAFDLDEVCGQVLANPHLRNLRRLEIENRYPTEEQLNGWAGEEWRTDELLPATDAALRAAFGDRVIWSA